MFLYHPGIKLQRNTVRFWVVFLLFDVTQGALYNNIATNTIDGTVVLDQCDRNFLELLKKN